MSRTFDYRYGDDERTVQVAKEGEQFRVSVGERTFVISAHAGESGRLDLCVDGRRQRAYVARQGDRTYVWFDGDVWTLVKPDPRHSRTPTQASGGSLEAAMPGRVLDVLVKVGDRVQRGDTVVLLEAMKMELRIQAPTDGEVTQVMVAPGAVVERGQLLVKVA